MSSPHIAVGIATTGRPATLTEILREVARQTRQPDRIILCPAKAGDIDEAALASLPFSVEIVHGEIGSSAQRNTILRAATSADLVLFLDDDFLIAPNYLAEMEALFAREPGCVAATGLVLADGATNQGFSVTQGREILTAYSGASQTVAPVFCTYGCNMAFRWSRLRETPCLFDENLPLYAWAEDVDFSRQAAVYGTVLKCDAMVGVHLSEKKGRVSGVRFGYSQIANQIYLVRKGTLPAAGSLRKIAENLAANLIGTLRNNEAYVDRRGRLVGNLRGLFDALIGRSSPKRVLEL